MNITELACIGGIVVGAVFGYIVGMVHVERRIRQISHDEAVKVMSSVLDKVDYSPNKW